LIASAFFSNSCSAENFSFCFSNDWKSLEEAIALNSVETLGPEEDVAAVVEDGTGVGNGDGHGVWDGVENSIGDGDCEGTGNVGSVGVGVWTDDRTQMLRMSVFLVGAAVEGTVVDAVECETGARVGGAVVGEVVAAVVASVVVVLDGDTISSSEAGVGLGAACVEADAYADAGVADLRILFGLTVLLMASGFHVLSTPLRLGAGVTSLAAASRSEGGSPRYVTLMSSSPMCMDGNTKRSSPGCNRCLCSMTGSISVQLRHGARASSHVRDVKRCIMCVC
jgi:hypothetical protein